MPPGIEAIGKLEGIELRLRCAAAARWTKVRRWGRHEDHVWGVDPRDGLEGEVPEFERSERAMYWAECTLAGDELDRYEAVLLELCAGQKGLAGRVWHARARVRCVAMIWVRESGATVEAAEG